MHTLTVEEGRFQVELVANSKRLVQVRFGLNRKSRKLSRPPFSNVVLRNSQRMLERYFQEGKPFGRVPLNWEQQSPFEKKVLRCVQKIPFGEVRSYGWLARQINMPGSARACGQALKRNRFVLFVPCHRVVGSSGLGGFSCGVRLKKKLLTHEQTFSKRNGQ